ATPGTHAPGDADHAQRTRDTATIVMPKSTPNVKVQRVREYCARVILHGQYFSEAAAEMNRVAQEESLTIIHPFDYAEIIEGQGTIAL
ncbi:pyridoxal-phosphate dependent enzyme, partial [Acinetobacter baumannii]|uniref:pyridoxal-phosphate dependent enzyme n=1 Tax=Acinetobacter baumannii TaxID=470 RepID=UPI003AF46815